MEPSKYSLKQYDMTIEDYRAMVRSAHRNLEVADDGDEYSATTLAEVVAHDLNHDEWLDDETHPLWDVAVDVAEAGDRHRCPHCSGASFSLDYSLSGSPTACCDRCGWEGRPGR